MSYTLTPILVDLSKVNSLMGSNDAALLQAVIRSERQEMLGVDAIGEDYDEFEEEIEAQYDAFVAGDFSSVDLNASYPEPDEDDEDDDEVDAMMEALDDIRSLDLTDPTALEQFAAKHAGLVADFFEDDEGDQDDQAEEDDLEDEDASRELTTGAALAHLILGGKQDPSQGWKYAYALYSLCKHLGEMAPNESWCSIRSAAFDLIDAALKRAGVASEAFSTSEMLVSRGAPAPIPESDDFPFVGYLMRDEIGHVLAALDQQAIQAAIESEETDQEWLESALAELRGWLEAAVTSNRDLICFYF